jgi:hypothetical protein
MRQFAFATTFVMALACAPAALAGDFDDAEEVGAWTARMDTGRRVVERVVVCFDHGSFLVEVAKWDAERYWPVLLWDSDLVPKFIAAFEPKEVLVANYAVAPDDELVAGMQTVAAAWGLPAENAPTDAKGFLAALTERERIPNGTVLLAPNSPELLGGIALAAGRMHMPMRFETAEVTSTAITSERVAELRKRLMSELEELGIDYAMKLDDLDFITVASDLPFSYTQSKPGAHPGRYTVDDAIARHDGDRRWGWVGRLTGGDLRSVYMAMGALFLQPKSGLFWSRYNPKNEVFGVFDPPPALDTFNEFFPTETIRHPDATLDRWRALQWPGGNRFGFVYVNSSGGATSWSMSKGKATHFDVPETIPCVIHYTHSGSAGQPFNTDTIAGRWMSGGAFVYFGSHAEPYLTAFIPPSELAKRVAVGVPLGAAMRLLYTPKLVGQRKMKVGDAEKLVRFNMSGPWKLAYFGDPSYRLLRTPPERVAPDELVGRYFSTPGAFRRFKQKNKEATVAHGTRALGTVRLDDSAVKLVDVRGWAKLVKIAPEGELSNALLREMLRNWVTSLRRTDAKKLYALKSLASLVKVPKPIRDLATRGATSPDGARLVTEFAKAYVSGLAAHPESAVGKSPAGALPLLVMACSFEHSKGARKPFYAWIVEASRGLDIAPDDLRAAIVKQDWLTDGVRKAVEAAVKGPLVPKAKATK